ncbi:DNA-3-methyladenine glycosylase [Furfurilactobacillus siliginis]|uniref:Putative 3-methyladenine DNA glycosylase n=1 Tax=Furfurilactobacillus siliginis TaxID=348151 RepID=A0A0R2L667_9LACO|nr:DNA-3-methyladenine glycosylase [Furfurilactobacillus siliginis]KRN95334.1 3-methyladenine DNA glycosylase [Furfurilactobacillus siliginis]GEK28268.1 putative 3-methyladenine DNA glycosylase [Furfurilactobacillus siliginis]
MLDQDFFTNRPTERIAADLLGHELLYQGENGTVGGLIVETEAYLGDLDTAAHAFGHRKSSANAALFSEPGTLYFYTMRGLILMNLICQPAGTPQGVLLRAIQPTQGEAKMRELRPQPGEEVTNGPAKLTQALGVTNLQWNNVSLAESPFSITDQRRLIPQEIGTAPRVGVSAGAWQDRELRFYVAGNAYVSGMRKRYMNWATQGWLQA